MAPLKHPHLVRMYGGVWSEGPDKLCLVLEYVDGGSLRGWLTPMKAGAWENPRFGFAHGIAKCFRYLHLERPEPLIHRDLKPGNVLLTHEGRIKISDMGFSKRLTQGQSSFETVSAGTTGLFCCCSRSLLLL